MAEKQTREEILDRHYAARGGARLTVQQHRPRRDGTGWTLAIVAALALVVGILIGATARADESCAGSITTTDAGWRCVETLSDVTASICKRYAADDTVAIIYDDTRCFFIRPSDGATIGCDSTGCTVGRTVRVVPSE